MLNQVGAEDKKRGKSKALVILVIAILFIIILLVLRSCSNTVPNEVDEPSDNTPIGNYDVVQEPQENEPEETEAPEETITFFGYGEYTVSKDNPKIELSNPEINSVTMVFSVIDNTTEAIIAKTNEIKPGEYVYVDIVDYYKEPGEYEITIHTETYSSEGQQMNGMNQEMAIHFIK